MACSQAVETRRIIVAASFHMLPADSIIKGQPRVRESSLGDTVAGQHLVEKTENPLPFREML